MNKDKRSGTGDELFSRLYNDYYPLVFGTLYTKIADREDVSDICQDIFVAMYNKLDEIREPRKWLYGTMSNMVKLYYSRKYKKDLDIDEVFNDIGLTYINGFRDTRILISEAIEQVDCNETEKIMIDLIATHNFTYTHVAKIVGMTVRQVTYQYKKLVNRIVELLRDKGIDRLEDLL